MFGVVCFGLIGFEALNRTLQVSDQVPTSDWDLCASLILRCFDLGAKGSVNKLVTLPVTTYPSEETYLKGKRVKTKVWEFFKKLPKV